MMDKKALVASTLFLVSIPVAFASTGIGAMDTVLGIIGNFFNFTALENENVQIGFLRIMIFIALFTISYFALKKATIFKDNNGKPAKVVGFVFSLIGAFLMPTSWLIATGGGITFLMSSIVFLLMFWGLTWVAVWYMKSNWVLNLFGIILLFLLLSLLGQWGDIVGLSDGGGYVLSSSTSTAPISTATVPADPPPQEPDGGATDEDGFPLNREGLVDPNQIQRGDPGPRLV